MMKVHQATFSRAMVCAPALLLLLLVAFLACVTLASVTHVSAAAVNSDDGRGKGADVEANDPSAYSSSSSSSDLLKHVEAALQQRQQPQLLPPLPHASARLPYGRWLAPEESIYERVEAGSKKDAAVVTGRLRRPVFAFGERPSSTTRKVFGVGLARTGTSSLARALYQLGLETIHADLDNTGTNTTRHTRTGRSVWVRSEMGRLG